MKIKEITFEQVIQVKQYQPCRISATAILNDSETPEEAIVKLKQFVQGELKKVYVNVKQKKTTK